MRVTGGARLGDDILVTVAIPPNDSPVGVFGFEEKSVSLISISVFSVKAGYWVCVSNAELILISLHCNGIYNYLCVAGFI